MITDAQFDAWLQSESRARVMLVEADYAMQADPTGYGVNVADGAAALGITEYAGNTADAVTNSERAGASYWRAATAGGFPTWVSVTFDSVYLVDRVAVYSLQDGAPSEPTDTTTCSLYQLTVFDVQVWNGWDWVTVASVTDNTLAKRTVTFSPYRTSGVRVLIHATADDISRVTEVEAFTPAQASGTEYIATHPFVSEPQDADPNRIYASIIKAVTPFKQSMSEVLIGRTTANYGTVEIVSSAATDAWLFERNWIGQRVRMFIGDQDWRRDDFRQVWGGVIADFRVKDTTTVILEFRDLQHLLNQPVVAEGVESGPLLSQPMPVAIGNFYNVPAILVDDVTHKYAIHDGSMSAITAVRDQGVLRGGVTLNESDGTFVLPGWPNGRITCDGTGALDDDGAAITTGASFIRYLAISRGYLTIDDLDIDSFITFAMTCPQPLGYWSSATGQTVYDVIDQVCNTLGAFTAVTRDGKLFVKRFDFDGYPTMAIGEMDIAQDGLKLERVYAPVRDVRIAAKRNYSPNSYTVGGFGSNVTEVDYNTYGNSHKHFARAHNEAGATIPKARHMRGIGTSAPVTLANSAEQDDGAIASLFVSQADAQAEAERRMRLWGFQRYLFRVTCSIRPMMLRLGDVVTLTHRRYGLSGGRNAVVTGIEERFGQKQVVLGLMV